MSLIKADEKSLKIVMGVLSRFFDSKAQSVWVFGSRANGSPRDNSDLDLLFDPSLNLETRALVAEAFDESNLAFEVDLVNKSDLAAAYADQINKSKVLIFGSTR
jgi:predicted nucleotidyltransferase